MGASLIGPVFSRLFRFLADQREGPLSFLSGWCIGKAISFTSLRSTGADSFEQA